MSLIVERVTGTSLRAFGASRYVYPQHDTGVTQITPFSNFQRMAMDDSEEALPSSDKPLYQNLFDHVAEPSQHADAFDPSLKVLFWAGVQ